MILQLTMALVATTTWAEHCFEFASDGILVCCIEEYDATEDHLHLYFTADDEAVILGMPVLSRDAPSLVTAHQVSDENYETLRSDHATGGYLYEFHRTRGPSIITAFGALVPPGTADQSAADRLASRARNDLAKLTVTPATFAPVTSGSVGDAALPPSCAYSMLSSTVTAMASASVWGVGIDTVADKLVAWWGLSPLWGQAIAAVYIAKESALGAIDGVKSEPSCWPTRDDGDDASGEGAEENTEEDNDSDDGNKDESEDEDSSNDEDDDDDSSSNDGGSGSDNSDNASDDQPEEYDITPTYDADTAEVPIPLLDLVSDYVTGDRLPGEQGDPTVDPPEPEVVTYDKPSPEDVRPWGANPYDPDGPDGAYGTDGNGRGGHLATPGTGYTDPTEWESFQQRGGGGGAGRSGGPSSQEQRALEEMRRAKEHEADFMVDPACLDDTADFVRSRGRDVYCP